MSPSPPSAAPLSEWLRWLEERDPLPDTAINPWGRRMIRDKRKWGASAGKPSKRAAVELEE